MAVTGTGRQRSLLEFALMSLPLLLTFAVQLFDSRQIRVQVQLTLVRIKQHPGSAGQRQHLHR
ncbi:hypothetical protein D3C71_1235400 [compost metagenome]